MEAISFIPARLRSAVKGGYVTGTTDIVDDDLQLDQHQINLNLTQRISDAEQLAQIAIDGTNIPIASVEDFNNPTQEQRIRIPTVWTILQNFYTKNQIDQKNLISQQEGDNGYYNRGEISSSYYNKHYIDENYYAKLDLDSRFQSLLDSIQQLIQEAVTNIKPDFQHVVLTQEQYDALEIKDNNTIYLIVESLPEPESPTGWTFPITLVSGTWKFGDTFPVILSGDTTWRFPIILS